MRTILLALLAVLGSTGCSRYQVEMDREYPGLAPEDDFVVNAGVRAGLRQMTDSDWEGLDQQLTLGIAWDARREGWPVAIASAVDFHQADYDDARGDTWESDTWEVSAGVQRTEIWMGGLMVQYGGGASYQRLILDGPAAFHRLDWAVGGYGQGGIGWLFGGWGIVGVTARVTETTEVRFRPGTEDLSAGAVQFMGVLGARF